MAKGASIKFKSYEETVPKILELTKFANELIKYKTIVLKPSLNQDSVSNTSVSFVESVLKFIKENTPEETRIFIAEGSDGADTHDLFEELGYKSLAEKYSISLIDLNNTESIEIRDREFLKFDSIHYPKILTDNMVISLPKLSEDPEFQVSTSISNMVGAFPAAHYKGFFSRSKNKIRKDPIKFAIHDITKCKMPESTIIDASDYGRIFIGDPYEIDKQAVKLISGEWTNVEHLSLIEETRKYKKELEIKKQKNQETIEAIRQRQYQ
jgi:uncharacterized protein (DUF362 family)